LKSKPVFGENRMSILEIQKYIKEFANIEDANALLREQLALEIKKDVLLFDNGTKENVWLYNYSHIRSPQNHVYVKESRGLILDENGDIISISFERFFNMGHPSAPKIQYGNALAEKKFDGSLIVVYNHKGKWFVQTRGDANASGRMSYESGISFYNGVLAVLRDKFGHDTPFKPFRDEEDCYVFEFVSPFNILVTRYKSTDLILLAVRNKKSLKEYKTEDVDRFAHAIGLKRPESYFVKDKKSIEELVELCERLEEGYVIVNPDMTRIKVKNQKYLEVSRMLNAGSEISPRNFANAVIAGTENDVLSIFPEYEEIINVFKKSFMEIYNNLIETWKLHGQLGLKEFAVKVGHLPFSGALFDFHKGKSDSIESSLRNVMSDRDLLNYTNKTNKDDVDYCFKRAITRR